MRTTRLYKRTDRHEKPRFFRAEDLPAWLTALFTVVLAYYAYRAWEEAHSQLSAIQDQLATAKVGQRAWIYADPSITVKIPRPITGPGWLIPLTFTFHNVGHETALHVRANVDTLILADMSGTSEQPALLASCDKTKNEFGDPLPTGITAFPGQTLSIASYAILSQPAWESAIKKLAANNAPITAGLEVVGCVRYEFATDHSEHRTYFAYTLTRQTGPLGAQLDQIDPKDLLFVPSIGDGAFDAN